MAAAAWTRQTEHFEGSIILSTMLSNKTTLHSQFLRTKVQGVNANSENISLNAKAFTLPRP